MPGYGLPIGDLIARVGFEDARELWSLSKQGADLVRANASEELMPGIGLTEGALEVSNVDVGDQLISRLQMLGEDFETEVEGWQVDRVRAELKTGHYFHGMYYPKGVSGRRPQICPRPGGAGAAGGGADFRGHAGRQHRPLRHSQAHRDAVGAAARLAHRAGRQHPSRRAAEAVVGDAAAGVALCRRHRAAWRAPRRGHHLPGIGHRQRRRRSVPDRRWRPADVGLAGDHLGGAAAAFCRRHRAPHPHHLSPVSARSRFEDVFGGAVGQTVHGMPQIGQLRKGLWVTSGFGRQGLNTSAIAGQLVAQGILWGDERWRLFSPFELVWAGGPTGRVAGHVVGLWGRGSSAAAGALARYRERARARERIREARLVEANRQAGTRPPRPRPPPGGPRPLRPAQPAAVDPGRRPPAKARMAIS